MKKWLIFVLACLFCVSFAWAEGVEGAAYAPDMDAWGTQGNNGWRYMKSVEENSYADMNYYTTSDIGWQQMAFASDPAADLEMFFISRGSFFTGELGTLPVYAFEVPADGRVELAFATHGQADMHIKICLDEQLIRDDISFNTTGADGGFTTHFTRMDVKAGQMIYMIGYTTGGNREGWVKNYTVTYLAPDASLEVNEEEARVEAKEQAAAAAAAYVDPGKTWAPDMDNFGVQGNNGFYYMVKNTAGEYSLMDYRTESDIGWQVKNFASDPNAVGEMYFISKNSGFVGELGSVPVYAFEAPIGGEIEFSALTHGAGGAAVRLVVDGQIVPLNGQEFVELTTDGAEGGFTKVCAKLTVKRGTMVYLELFTTGGGREGWIKDYKVTYNSYNPQVVEALGDKVFVPDHEENWGKKENNNWSYKFLDKATGNIRKLAFVRSDDHFTGASGSGYEYLLIMRKAMHPALNADPIMCFTAPRDGQVRLMVIACIGAFEMSPTSTGVAVWHNETKVWPAEEDFFKLSKDTQRVILVQDVKAGETLNVLLDGLNGNINYDETAIQVLAEYID